MKPSSRRIESAALALCLLASPAAGSVPVRFDDSQLIDRIYRHVSDFEREFPVTRSSRITTVREFHPRSGQLRKTSVSHETVVGRVGEKPEVTVLECEIDGVESDLRDCQRRENNRPPLFRVFGPEGRNHYRFEVTRPDEGADPATYRLLVIPLERTQRHFEGEFELLAEDLSLLSTRGTLADLPLGLKKFALELTFGHAQGRPIPTRSRVDMTLYLPLILNLRVVSESVATEVSLGSDD